MAKINNDDLKIGVTFISCRKCTRVEIACGQWEKYKHEDGKTYRRCSVCHIPAITVVRGVSYIEQALTPYCYACGAKMVKGRNDIQ